MRLGVITLTLSLAVGLGLSLLSAAEEPAASIQVITKVGREGAGNAEAAAAWKSLVRSGPEALLPILRALKDDAPLAANWLRPAFEAVAEKALAAKKLPTAELTAYLEDTKNGGKARRI